MPSIAWVIAQHRVGDAAVPQVDCWELADAFADDRFERRQQPDQERGFQHIDVALDGFNLHLTCFKNKGFEAGGPPVHLVGSRLSDQLGPNGNFQMSN